MMYKYLVPVSKFHDEEKDDTREKLNKSVQVQCFSKPKSFACICKSRSNTQVDQMIKQRPGRYNAKFIAVIKMKVGPKRTVRLQHDTEYLQVESTVMSTNDDTVEPVG